MGKKHRCWDSGSKKPSANISLARCRMLSPPVLKHMQRNSTKLYGTKVLCARVLLGHPHNIFQNTKQTPPQLAAGRAGNRATSCGTGVRMSGCLVFLAKKKK